MISFYKNFLSARFSIHPAYLLSLLNFFVFCFSSNPNVYAMYFSYLNVRATTYKRDKNLYTEV